MKIRDIAIIGCLIWLIFIISMLEIRITLKKKASPAEVEVQIEEHPMMYTWDDGSEC